ncbi:MarR family winged helix-turn-helix transcriptional regulator [Herbiconiux sp. SYSU D00978]|uniref:MarR family winged helix-turn-helix transcriptional regulator n=1 Tax=Herbiconiux sp. SYSU D00978 TaxID=2812562 RepID=UPI001F60B9B9|nr:MarR family winged helix-turn-helix transcriptional regulator [Herbiconiux sp. SYSU D00978]
MSGLSADERRLWIDFVAMRRQLDRALAEQLQRDGSLSSADFDILITLFEAPNRRLRAGALADLLGWEKSRVSHQVTRMSSRGLLERVECEDDARGSWISLTADGRRAVLKVMRGHFAEIRRLFFDALTPEQLAAVSGISQSVLHAIQPPVCDEVRRGA